MIMVEKEEWVVKVEKVFYCNKEHEPLVLMDRPECPVCEGPMSETGWFESATL